MLRIVGCVADCCFGVPQATEWQRVGNQIEAALIFARADFVGIACFGLGERIVNQSLLTPPDSDDRDLDVRKERAANETKKEN